MKRAIIASLMSLILLGACNSEKKVTQYSDIYNERTTTIYLAPVIDNAVRKVEKYPKDIAYNNELNTAKAYLYQTMPNPLLKKGYYVIGSVASHQIAKENPMTNKELRNGDLKVLNTRYGIDAVLVTTIHRWKEENGKWIAYMEYQLRSTKTNIDLMHVWVLATKQVPTNLKGDPITLRSDMNFARQFEMDNGSAQRAFLMEKVNDYVLRDLPISSLRRQFEDDLYRSANQTYIKYTWTEEGGADVQPCSIEEYEQGCFI